MKRSLPRWAIGLGILMLAVTLGGCLIEGEEKTPEFFSYVRLQPGDIFSGGALEAAPDNTIYQLWVINLFGFGLGDFAPLVRFQWDPENYVARDTLGEILPLTTGSGMDMGINVLEWDALMLTIQRTDVDPIPELGGLGPIILFSNPLQTGTRRDMISPIEVLSFLGIPELENTTYTLISQSNKRGNPDANWRDGSEGLGIWFAEPETKNLTVLDPLVTYEVYQKSVNPTREGPGPENGDSLFNYTLWLNTAFPESSFCNFGRVFDHQQVDLLFVDGVPQHDSTDQDNFAISAVVQTERPFFENNTLAGYVYLSDAGDVCSLFIKQPWRTHCNTDPFPSLLHSPWFNAGFRPDSAVVIDGDTVGYVYYSEDGTERCELRIDDPNLSQCENERDFYAQIFDAIVGDTARRQGTITDGDTTVTGTLPEAPLLPQVNAFLLEYEAWLIFTPESEIPPLSMGRFGYDTIPALFPIPGFDSMQVVVSAEVPDQSNRYTDNNDFDENFHFPGEDFLQGLSEHHPDLPDLLNVINSGLALKIWITLEPAQLLVSLQGSIPINLDWAPDEPFTQLIVYAGWLPDTTTFVPDILGTDTTLPLVARDLIFRDLNTDPNPRASLTDGHIWPTMTVFLSNEAE